MADTVNKDCRNFGCPLFTHPSTETKEDNRMYEDRKSMELEALVSFGEVGQWGNRNLGLTGSNNQGDMENNRNLQIQSYHSELNLFNNTDIKLKIANSTIDASKVADSNIVGTYNELKLENDRLLNFTGTANQCRFESNERLKWHGHNGKGTFVGNTDTRISGDNNEILAFDNHQLKIKGDNNKVSVTKTYNHQLKAVKPNSEKGPLSNWIEILPSTEEESTWINLVSTYGFFSGRRTDVKCYIEYVQEASIKSNQYKLGIFRLTFLREHNCTYPLNEEQISVVFNNEDLDDGSFKIVNLTRKSVTVSAAKGGNVQHLKVSCPELTPRADIPHALYINI